MAELQKSQHEEEAPAPPPAEEHHQPLHEEDEDEDDEEEEEVEQDEEEEEGEEESLAPPSKVARVSSEPSTEAVTISSPSPLVLGLGLGVGTSAAEPVKPSFTFMQRQELHHHLRIFDYIVRRAPVPLDLVLPIWKSVAASYGPHHYPSFVGLGNLCYDFRNSMEPEPGRCRRTDGKKWRCSRDVIPDQKYCERHMHRGRVRSRKPVEAEVSADASAAPAAAAAASAAAAPIGSNHNASASAAAAPAATVGLSPTSVLASSGSCENPVPVEE